MDNFKVVQVLLIIFPHYGVVEFETTDDLNSCYVFPLIRNSIPK
jgi:hypothetical protein